MKSVYLLYILLFTAFVSEQGVCQTTANVETDSAKLSLKEQIRYEILHPSTFSQQCFLLPPDPEKDKKIFGQLPNPYQEFRWSDKQIAFFKKNRDAVMALVKADWVPGTQLDINAKKLIVLVEGIEMIPFLDKVYQDSNDKEILTVFILLMKNAQYLVFKASLLHENMYGAASNYRGYVLYSKDIRNEILKYVHGFYDTRLPK